MSEEAKVEKPTVCQEADRLVSGEKRETYGPVGDGLRRTAMVWSAVLDRPVTPEQVALCMLGLKIVRECNKSSRENQIDMCGYAKVLELYHEELAAEAKAVEDKLGGVRAGVGRVVNIIYDIAHKPNPHPLPTEKQNVSDAEVQTITTVWGKVLAGSERYDEPMNGGGV